MNGVGVKSLTSVKLKTVGPFIPCFGTREMTNKLTFFEQRLNNFFLTKIRNKKIKTYLKRVLNYYTPTRGNFSFKIKCILII